MCWDGLTTEMCWAEVINTVSGCCIGLLHNDESVPVTLRCGLGMVTGNSSHGLFHSFLHCSTLDGLGKPRKIAFRTVNTVTGHVTQS